MKVHAIAEEYKLNNYADLIDKRADVYERKREYKEVSEQLLRQIRVQENNRHIVQQMEEKERKMIEEYNQRMAQDNKIILKKTS